MARNIILTTIDDSSDILNMKYFVKKESTEEEFNSSVYCHSTIDGEALVKYILSKYKIDEIIIFGNKSCYNPDDELKDIELRKSAEFITASQQKLSTYSLYRYRLEQYLDMLDFSYSDLQECLSLEDMDQLSDAVDKYSRKIIADGKRPARIFSAVAESDELWSEVLNEIRELLNVNELSNAQIAAIKYLLYLRMSDKNKMEILEENEKVAVSFIPVDQRQDSQRKSLINSLNKIWFSSEEAVNVYVGVHAGNVSASSFLMSLLNVLTELGEINIKKIFSIHKNDDGFGYNILDDTDQYHYTHLLDGIISFVNTGKVDKIMEALNSIGYVDELSRDMVYEMRNIDASISLCDIDKMVEGLEGLKKMITQKQDSNGQVYSLFETVLKKGYGSLLEGDSIDVFDLIKWSYSRKLYQQALTIIESKIPNDMFDRGLYYYCSSQEDKEKATTQFAECYNLLKRHETYKMKHLEHYYIKFYGRAEARTSEKDPKHQALSFAKFKTGQIATIGKTQVKDNKCTDGLIPAHTLSNNLQAVEDALFAYYYIGNIRNMTNHADTGENNDIELFPDVTEDIQKMKIVTEAIEFFIKKYEAAIQSVAENIPEGETAATTAGGPVRIPSYEVRKIARNLFEERKQNEQTNNNKL